jgi:hypothetical protein
MRASPRDAEAAGAGRRPSALPAGEGLGGTGLSLRPSRIGVVAGSRWDRADRTGARRDYRRSASSRSGRRGGARAAARGAVRALIPERPVASLEHAPPIASREGVLLPGRRRARPRMPRGPIGASAAPPVGPSLCACQSLTARSGRDRDGWSTRCATGRPERGPPRFITAAATARLRRRTVRGVRRLRGGRLGVTGRFLESPDARRTGRAALTVRRPQGHQASASDKGVTSVHAGRGREGRPPQRQALGSAAGFPGQGSPAPI